MQLPKIVVYLLPRHLSLSLLLLATVAIAPLIQGDSDSRESLEQLIELRSELYSESKEVKESLADLSSDERRVRMREWRAENADLFDGIRDVAMELSSPAEAPPEISEAEWQHRSAHLPPDLREFMEARRSMRTDLMESRSGASMSDKKRQEISAKLSQLRELGRNLASESYPLPPLPPENPALLESLFPSQAAAFQLRRELALERRQLENDTANTSRDERARALQEWMEESAPRRNELLHLLQPSEKH